MNLNEGAGLTSDILTFSFNGETYFARRGETIAAALYRSGIRVLTRSQKFHRARGLYCGTGDCPNCLVDVDGIPNTRSCSTAVCNGMVVRSQNSLLSLEIDPLGLMDLLYAHGFNYHSKFIRPTFATGIYQSIIRRLAGQGEMPKGKVDAEPTQKINADLFIAGGGSGTRDIAERVAARGVRTILTQEGDYQPNARGLTIIPDSTVLGAFDDGRIAVSTRDRMYLVLPKMILLSEPPREQPMRFFNWDLPGILQETAARKLLEGGASLGNRALIAGDSTRAISLAKDMRCRGFMPAAIVADGIQRDLIPETKKLSGSILSANGRIRVNSATIEMNGRRMRVKCDCIVTCGPLIPRTELARQLGCSISYSKDLPSRIVVDGELETSIKSTYAFSGLAGSYDDEISAALVETLSRRAKEAGP